jgi:hypothetical protein
MKVVRPWLVRWAHRAGTTDFCPALTALVGQGQNFFSLPYGILIYLSPSPSKLGRQLCRFLWVPGILYNVWPGKVGCWVVLETIYYRTFTICMGPDSHSTKLLAHLKGTVSRDFSLLVFFNNQIHFVY